MAYRDTILADSPAAYFELEQTSGDPVNSGSHSIPSYTVAGSGVSRNAAGKIGNAWALTTRSGYVVGTHGSDDSGAYSDNTFSIEVWVKVDATTTNDYIAVLGSTASGNNAYIYKSNTGKAVAVVKGSATTAVSVTGTTTISDGNWHHIVLTVNGVTKRLYVDGVLEATSTTSHGSFAPTTHQVVIGNSASTNLSAVGSYDEFATYPTELTAARVLAHYDAANVTAGTNAGYTAEAMTASASTPQGSAARGNTVRPTDDTYVVTGSAAVYGGETVLNVDGTSRTLIKIPAIAVGGSEGITSLRLLVNTGSTYLGNNIQVRRIDADWSESTVHGNNVPASTLIRTVALDPKPLMGRQVVEFDIAGTEGAFGVMLQASGTWAGGAFQFDSSESATAAQRPYIMYAISPTANYNITTTPATASAEMTDGTGAGNKRTMSVTEDAHTSTTYPDTNYATDPTLSIGRGYFKVPATTLVGGETPSDYKLVLTRSGTGTFAAHTMGVARITADWDESTVTYNNAPPATVVRNISIPQTVAGASVTIDISDILAEPNFGVRLTAGGSGATWSSSESGPNGPKITYAVTPPTPVTITPTALTASAVMPPSSGGGGTGANINAEPFGAHAEEVDVAVSTGRALNTNVAPMYAVGDVANATVYAGTVIDNTVDVAVFEADASMGQDSNFVVHAPNSAEPMTSEATTTDVLVETTKGVIFKAAAARAEAGMVRPMVNSQVITVAEAEDKFFQRAMGLGPASWLRLNDNGSTAVNRIKPTGVDGTYVGVQTGQDNGPDGRHSVYFGGSGQLSLNNTSATQGSLSNATLEFSFRTTKKNQFLMVSSDLRSGTGSQTETTREIVMRNGRLVYRAYNAASRTQAAPDLEFTGFRDLADGQWHTVVIRSVDTDPANSASIDGIEVYIDGKFEIRRGGAQHTGIGFPDYIGSRPNTVAYDTLPALPSSEYFVGDMSEIILWNRTLTPDNIAHLYYDFMAWTAIEVQSMDAFTFMTAGNHGRGNQKRALVLQWDAQEDGYNAGAGGNSGTMNFDPIAGLRGAFGAIYNNSTLDGYKVFLQGVTAPMTVIEETNVLGDRGLLYGTVGQYRDAVYDMPTLIDLERDVDIKDYDVIMFTDWPDEGVEEDFLRNNFPNFTADKERLLRQLRDANDKGVGLLVTHPRLAADLGIVDRVEYVPTLKESYGRTAFQNPNDLGFQGNASGLYDYGSAVKFPWNISADAGLSQGAAGAAGTGEAMNTDPAYLDYKAYFFGDQNFNNKFRVRALINGLTDIPAYIIKDTAYHVDADIWGDDFGAINLEDRRTGLTIGDEFIFHGTNVAGLDWDNFSNLNGLEYGRPYGYYAVPVNNVKAGTVVTTFGATHWRGKSVVDNPYKDYATTIVLDHGDVLAGRSVGGRIFVSFTEAPAYLEQALAVDILPGSEWDDGTAVWPSNYKPDTEAQRDWERSGTRINVGNTSIGGRIVETSVTMPDGSTAIVRSPGSAGNGLISSNYSSLFGTAYVPRWDMTRRGMWWVGRGEKPAEGEIRVGSDSLEATAAMPEPVVTAQRDGGYNAEPMIGLAQVTRVEESTVGDVEIRTLPVTAAAEFTGFSLVLRVEPMEATATLVENFDMVHATGEQVVLTLHGVDATLYLKEETT